MAQPTIKPLADMVLAAPDKAEAKTTSGLYLPDNAKEKPETATVQAVGSDVKAVKPGDRIIYESYTGKEIKHAGVDYVLVKEEKVLAKVA